MTSQPEDLPEEPPHIHHWILDEESHGRCRGCGEERQFTLSPEMTSRFSLIDDDRNTTVFE